MAKSLGRKTRIAKQVGNAVFVESFMGGTPTGETITWAEDSRERAEFVAKVINKLIREERAACLEIAATASDNRTWAGQMAGKSVGWDADEIDGGIAYVISRRGKAVRTKKV